MTAGGLFTLVAGLHQRPSQAALGAFALHRGSVGPARAMTYQASSFPRVSDFRSGSGDRLARSHRASGGRDAERRSYSNSRTRGGYVHFLRSDTSNQYPYR